MTTNLRVEFHKRQHKHLSEYIVIGLSPSKKVCSAPGLDSLSKPTPLTPIAIVASGLDDEPSSIGDIPYHKMRKPFVVSKSIIKDSFKCPNPSLHRLKPTYVPNWEEVSEFLRCTLVFTEKESLM